jgi:hypothetical protein
MEANTNAAQQYEEYQNNPGGLRASNGKGYHEDRKGGGGGAENSGQ